jgi:ElaB/YqjD/DUF883 family membrane-anchored ribosome-binding protein
MEDHMVDKELDVNMMQGIEDSLGGFADKVKQGARTMYEKGSEGAHDVVKRVDASIHRKLWPVLGGAVLGGLLFGVLLGRLRK